jgi:hypothetical protein
LRQREQIVDAKQRSPFSYGSHWVGRNNICPIGRHCNQLLFFVMEINAVLAPGLLMVDEFESPATPWMERMNYQERMPPKVA